MSRDFRMSNIKLAKEMSTKSAHQVMGKEIENFQNLNADEVFDVRLAVDVCIRRTLMSPSTQPCHRSV